MRNVQISVEQLIETVVREVMAELTRRGIDIGSPGTRARGAPVQIAPGGSLEIDMSAYRTPVLTESRLARIDATVSTILVPCNTVVTPGAWGVLRAKKLTLVRKAQTKG